MTKYYHTFPNYICDPGACEIALTGPLWISSAQVATILQLKFIPQVRQVLSVCLFLWKHLETAC